MMTALMAMWKLVTVFGHVRSIKLPWRDPTGSISNPAAIMTAASLRQERQHVMYRFGQRSGPMIVIPVIVRMMIAMKPAFLAIGNGIFGESSSVFCCSACFAAY